jgi:aminoglycoside phosphotransferase (APT) family kinase protein
VYSDAADDEPWLILEYLEQTIRFSRSSEPDAALMAADWIGHFHAASQQLVRTAALSFLKSYDEAYYLGWVQRVRRYHGHSHRSMPWLEQLCARFGEAVSVLTSVPPTIIHGEYYPENVLSRDKRIHPVDWESTAMAPGEIDLASMTEGWPEEIVRECEAQYQAARWPQGTPDGFDRRLWAARLYLQFRWLGDRSQLDDSEWRLELLHSAGKRLSLI